MNLRNFAYIDPPICKLLANSKRVTKRATYKHTHTRIDRERERESEWRRRRQKEREKGASSQQEVLLGKALLFLFKQVPFSLTCMLHTYIAYVKLDLFITIFLYIYFLCIISVTLCLVYSDDCESINECFCFWLLQQCKK